MNDRRALIPKPPRTPEIFRRLNEEDLEHHDRDLTAARGEPLGKL
jgi:hypothetical protein